MPRCSSRLGNFTRFCAVAFCVAAIACSGATSAPDRPSSQGYLDHALALMRANAVYAPGRGWKAVTETAHAKAAKVTGLAGTYDAIRSAVGQLRRVGDRHAVFLDPVTAKRLRPGGVLRSGPSLAPTVLLLDGRFGMISLPGIVSPPASLNARHYATNALARISRLQTLQHPCGWIVDLRDDTGGDMAPMLFGVGPILGAGRLVGFTRDNGFVDYVSYRGNTLTARRWSLRTPMAVADFTPTPPVAVLTGPRTFSAGEAVAIAVRGRPRTQSFGTATGGGPMSPNFYRLADGAMLGFAVVFDVDRVRTVYKQPIEPDVVRRIGLLSAAEQWLGTTRSCSQRRDGDHGAG